jgi:hypothetical protein
MKTQYRPDDVTSGGIGADRVQSEVISLILTYAAVSSMEA